MGQTRILIVEDEILVARDLQQQLTALGYTIVGIAANGAHALQLVKEQQPQLVLMDIRLQGEMDGITTAEQIRNQYLLPVVYLTAHADNATVQRARVTEPFGYILKPFEERELRTIIEMALYKHEADRKLRASERRYATTLHSIGDAVIATDEQSFITFMNPTAEALTDWTLAAAVGKPLAEIFHIVHEETRQPVVSPAEQVLNEGIAVGLANHTILITRQGREVPIDDSAAPILDDHGNCTGVVLVFRDISERREAEAKLRESEARLRQGQKMEAIGQLAAGIAHDFNNLLTVINGYSSMLLNLIEQNSSWQKYVQRVLSAGKRAEELTHQLLAFSRRQILQPRILNLNQVVTDMEQMLTRLLGEGIQITSTLDPALGSVRADPGQIEQVIMNLAVNARDAMPAGGVITIRTANVELDEAQARTLPDLQPGPHACLVVQDTGLGMDERVQAHIFEPFFTTKDRGKGTGLGLATVYGIVKQSDGHIVAQSQVGHGTTFTIYLPVVQDTPQTSVYHLQMLDLPRGAETILLVEDEDAVRSFAREVLEICGYQVLEAQNGVSALQVSAVYTDPIHLLLTDIVMPQMSGWELAERLISQQRLTKILYMSGYTDSVHLGSNRQKGGVNLLLKPFTPDALARKLRSLLDDSTDTPSGS